MKIVVQAVLTVGYFDCYLKVCIRALCCVDADALVLTL